MNITNWSTNPTTLPYYIKINKELFLKIVKQYSYFKDSVDWEEFEKILKSLPEQMKTLEPTNELLKKIDKHSFAVINYKDTNESTKLTQDVQQVESEEYNEDIGILKLHGFYSSDSNDEHYKKNYREIVSALEKLKDKKYLVLDITENSGGNMYPWFAALAPIYDIDTVGYFEYKYKAERDAWLIKDNGVYCGDRKWFDGKNINKYNFNKIAVLISPQTVSSGEAIALSLKNQDNVKLFGKKTAGFTTGNEDYEIGDVTIWLSTGMMQDRNCQSYPDGVTPNIETNDALESAIEWLKSK